MNSMQKNADIDWDKVKKYLAAGLLMGGGAGLGTSLASHLINLRRELDRGNKPSPDTIKIHLPPKQADHATEHVPSPDWEGSVPAEMASDLIASEGRDKHHLIKNPFFQTRIKEASINKSADPRTMALSIIAAILGGTGGYTGVRSVYQGARKKELQSELENAQNVYLQRMGEKSSAFGRKKDFSMTDKLVGIPMAAWLLGALGSGMVTNRLLGQIVEESRPRMQTLQPKKVEVVNTPVKAANEELPITEAHIRHLIKTAIATSVMSDKPMSWLLDTGLVDAAIAAKYGFDIFKSAEIEGDPLNFVKAGALYFGTHDIARDELNEAITNPFAFIAHDDNRRWVNEVILKDMRKTAAALGVHCFKDGVIPTLCEKMASEVAAIWDVIPEFVALDDAGCPQEKWADEGVGGIKNVLATKALYDSVVKPMILGKKEEQQSPAEEEKKDEAAKVEAPQIIAKDPQSKAFVDRNKDKIEEIVEKSGADLLKELASVLSPSKLPTGGSEGRRLIRNASKALAEKAGLSEEQARQIILRHKMPTKKGSDVTGADNFGAANVGTTTPYPPPSPKTDQDVEADKLLSEKSKRLANYLRKASVALDGVAEGKNIKVPSEEMRIGKEVESEHSSDPKVQEKIVKDHEVEEKELTGKPRYYAGGAKALFADIAKAKKACVLRRIVKSSGVLLPEPKYLDKLKKAMDAAKSIDGSKNQALMTRNMGGGVTNLAEGSGLPIR